MNSEYKKLEELLLAYVRIERKYPYEKQAKMFYRHAKGLFYTEQIKNEVPDESSQLKLMRDTRKRFFKNYTEGYDDAKAFHRYFYKKYLQDIQARRKIVTGVPYSTKSVKYLESMKIK